MSSKHQTTIARLCAACAFSALIVGSSHVRADETTNALLDLLKSKGAITQTEYEKIKARQQAEAKDSAQKLQAAETRTREAEAKAREAEAKAKQAEAKAQSDSAASEAEIAKVKAQTLTAADMPIPSKMPAKSPLEYVTVLPNCVGMRVGEVDICTKGDISFFAVEDSPERSPTTITGGLAAAGQHDSNAIRAGLLPSSFQVSLATHQMGLDIGVYFGVYIGGNNVGVGTTTPGTAAIGGNPLNANGPGAPFALGTAGVDFRQVFGTIGNPAWGTFKVGRDIGVFGSDAILNDLTLFGVGSPSANLTPTNTSLGRIGIGYIYADFIPQITYKSPTWAGFYFQVAAMTPMDEIPPFGDLSSGFMTGHSTPMGQAKVSWTGTWSPQVKLTLSSSGVIQKQQSDCFTGSLSAVGGIVGCPVAQGIPGTPVTLAPTGFPANASTTAWAVDGFAMLDVYGFNFVAYGYTGKGVGTTGLFFDGVDIFGNPRKSSGGYLQGAYTFAGGWLLPQPLTVGGSWGVSRLDTANSTDAAFVNTECLGDLPGQVSGVLGPSCLVHQNESWIAFARYKLTKWVNIQAEYVNTTAKSQTFTDAAGNTFQNRNRDQAVVLGTTFFW
jgi:predicted porin